MLVVVLHQGQLVTMNLLQLPKQQQNRLHYQLGCQYCKRLFQLQLYLVNYMLHS